MVSLHSKQLLVLQLDDDLLEIDQLKHQLAGEPTDVTVALESYSDPDAFLTRIEQKPAADIIILDIDLKSKVGLTGIQLIREIRKNLPQCSIIMQSNLDRVSTIKDCLQEGADDFISKKTDEKGLKLRIILSHEAAKFKKGFHGQRVSPPNHVVGKSMQELASRVPKILNSAISAIHIYGESGTGKEMVADLFEANLKPGIPFVRVHCGAISGALMESELFGYKKGAFTGADKDHDGLIATGDGGYVFLDEVATLTPAAQIALLRVLENGEIRPVGAAKSKKVNIKVISATNEDLEKLILEGKFRQDLWQRLSELRLEIKPLRNRADEIPSLIRHFVASMNGGPYTISEPTVMALATYSWRNGNIRELRNCLRAMTEFAHEKTLTPLCIPDWIWQEIEKQVASESSDAELVIKPSEIKINLPSEKSVDFEDLTDNLLLSLIRKLADDNGKSSMRSVGMALGIPRSTLNGRLRSLIQKGKIAHDELGRLINIGKLN